MKAYCPNCGSENEGIAGSRITCRACTANFDAPDAAPGGGAPDAAPPPKARPVRAAHPMQGSIAGWEKGGQSVVTARPGAADQHPLAVVSLVLGILCCIPFSGVAAIITGVMARNQIAESGGRQGGAELATAGIVLGSISVLMSGAAIVLRLVTGLFIPH
jgi:hypothetical protein